MWKAEIMTHHTQGGLEINTDCQVMSVDGKPILGLYAAGEVTGGIHGSNRLAAMLLRILSSSVVLRARMRQLAKASIKASIL